MDAKAFDGDFAVASQLSDERLAGVWLGDVDRRGMQFESVSFKAGGLLEAHIVTMCVRGYCPSIESRGTYTLTGGRALTLTLDGVEQRFEGWIEDGVLALREPVSGLTKRYNRCDSEAPDAC
jgi:hypothetical protein